MSWEHGARVGIHNGLRRQGEKEGQIWKVYVQMNSGRATERGVHEYRRKGNVGLSRRGKKSEWQGQQVHFPKGLSLGVWSCYILPVAYSCANYWKWCFITL